MVAEILCIGTELLIGDIINTNAAFLSKQLSEHGVDVHYQSVCGDNKVRLEECIHLALKRSDIVFTTGGLGPTYDDITLDIFAKAFGLELYKDETVEKAIVDYFKKMGRPMTSNNLKQALVPKGATVLMNSCGTAPGIYIEENGKCAVLMPGPPREMKTMFLDQVLPIITQKTGKVLVSSNVNIFGMGESSVEEKLSDLMTRFTNPTLAPYVNDGEVRVRISASGKDEAEAKSKILPLTETIKERLGDAVYGVDSDSIEFSLIKKLRENKLTISTAESCTGGLLSKMLTDVSGASEVFGFGVCTYANEAKMRLLSVKEETLEKYGAVSEKTAIEMACGIRTLSGSDIALSLTGIAGPSGGTEEKPVGLVYLGVAVGDKAYAKELLLARHTNTDRAYIRTLAAKNAIKEALDVIESMVKS